MSKRSGQPSHVACGFQFGNMGQVSSRNVGAAGIEKEFRLFKLVKRRKSKEVVQQRRPGERGAEKV